MRTEQPDRQSKRLEDGRQLGGRLAAVKNRHAARVQLAAATALLSGIAAVGLVGAPAQASNLTSSAAETSTSTVTVATTTAAETAAAGYFGTFTGNGVRIWSRPGGGVVRGLGYRGQGFCTDSLRSGYYHGRNTKTGVVGWASAKYVDTHLLLEC